MEVQDIITKAGIWVSSIGGGVVVIKSLTRIALAVINLIIKKLPIKLATEDREAIAEIAADKTVSKLASGIDVSMSDELDKHALKRVTSCEDAINSVNKRQDRFDALLVRVAKVVSDLKSPSSTYTGDLKSYISEFEVPQAVVPVIENKVKTTAKLSKLIKPASNDKY